MFEGTMRELTLTKELDEKNYQAYRLGAPGTRINSCRIVGTPEGVVILGDLSPRDNRGVVAHHKSILWFAGRNMSPCYLGEKFLEKDFHGKLAVEELRSWVNDNRDCYGEPLTEELVEGLEEVIKAVDDGVMGSEGLYEALYDLDPHWVDEGIVGWGYKPRDLDLLCAIQARFSELYWEMHDAAGQEDNPGHTRET